MSSLISSISRLMPYGRPGLTRDRLMPKGRFHQLSVILLWIVFLLYLDYWIRMHAGMLFDTFFQNDDTRNLYPFHCYGIQGVFSNDPVAAQVLLSSHPLVIWLLYRLLMPLAGIYLAPKLVQIASFAIIGLSGFLLIRSRRGGLAAGLILVFMMFHFYIVPNRIAGGLARAFAFPALALWGSGVIAGSERTRWAGALLAGATYPVAMLLILAGEFFDLLAGRASWRSGVFRSKGRKLILLCVVCLLITLPFILAAKRSGTSFSSAQVTSAPVFGKEGRWPILHPQDIYRLISKGWRYLSGNAAAAGASNIRFSPSERIILISAVFAGLAVLICLFFRSRPPPPALALIAASCACYAIAWIFLFHFYLPQRYFEYGFPAAVILLVPAVFARLFQGKLGIARFTRRNFAACAFITAAFFVPGAVVRNNGMTVNFFTLSKLYKFVSTLPPGILIASHPNDGNDIPYWSERAVVASYETLVPLNVEYWEQGKKRAYDTFNALYAVDRKILLDYCDNYQVTHLFVHSARYGPFFKEYAGFFEPFKSFLREKLAHIRPEDLVLSRVPKDAIIFRDKGFYLVEVKRLRRAWKKIPMIRPAPSTRPAK
ncbi:hypothetical protein ACFL6Y_03640 [Elusimicrobiota bacterium]